MNVEAHLERIGYEGPREPTATALSGLHRAHLRTVPFENLDISLGRRIDLALPALFRKIVIRRRGGFCYELNALFGWLLRELGFRVDLLSGRVFSQEVPGPEFDHMLLLVHEEGGFIADVGFGDSFIDPLPLAPGERQQRGRSYRLVEGEEGRVLQRRLPGAGWEPQYVFSPQPRRLEQFEPMCRIQETSPDSVFRKKSICSRATEAGRITLTHERLIVTEGERREERSVDEAAEYRALLLSRFGIDLGELSRIPLPAALRSGGRA